MIKFTKTEYNNIKELADLACEIWFEYWPLILSEKQISYMVKKFQSENAIKYQINNENYSYYFILIDDKKVGYFGLSVHEDYLFLSKLYIKKDYRHKGIGKKAFNRIKEIAQEYGLNKVRLTVNKYNTDTINAYKKWGLKEIDSTVTDIGEGFVMDDYIMEYQIIS